MVDVVLIPFLVTLLFLLSVLVLIMLGEIANAVVSPVVVS